MLRTGHHWTGALMGVAVAGLAHQFSVSIASWQLAAIVIAGWYGGVAPDSLEIRKNWRDRKGWHSKTLIPHRTITHVFLWWAVAAVFVGTSLLMHAEWTLRAALPAWMLFGFLLGGCTHILVDWPNPMGVPLWFPHARHSLRLWRSGEHELEIVLAFGVLAWACWGFPA